MVITAPGDLSQAYEQCERLAREHPENFPVASWLLPKDLRKHVAAIYAFARTADDFADEPGRSIGERLQLLDEWHRRLVSGDPGPAHDPLFASGGTEVARSDAGRATGRDRGGLFAALAHTRQQFDLPLSLFEDLLSAFRQDVTKTRYDAWDEVFDYCRRSANPVGRLVLRLFGYRSPELDRASDAVCTALQLTNFWQDFAVDWSRGRLYLPAEEWRRTGASTRDLDNGLITREWQTALRQAAHRTRELFAAGRPVADGVDGRLRYELRATWHGGVRVLDQLDAGRFDVFNRRPTLRLRDGLVIALKTVFWRRHGG